MKSFLHAFVLFCSLSLLVSAQEEYRVENEFRAENAPKPVRSTTLFQGNLFYDFIEENGEITVFNPQKDVITLLNPLLRIQTFLAASETKKKIEFHRTQNATHSTPFIAFIAKPTFQSETDPASGTIALQSPWIDYRIKTKTIPDAEFARLYFDFCDWSCYLNFRINPTLPTSLTRLEVNRILREQNRFPNEITVSFYPKGKGLLNKETKYQATHQVSRRLTDADKKRIEQAAEYMRAFSTVPFDEYQSKVLEKEPPHK